MSTGISLFPQVPMITNVRPHPGDRLKSGESDPVSRSARHRQESLSSGHRPRRHPAGFDGTRKEHMEFLVTVPLLILDDLGMRKLPLTAAEELLEIIMRRYERASTILTSDRPVEDWGKLMGDAAAVSAMLDRLLHHGHVLKCGPRSWRTKTDLPPQEAAG